MYLDLFQLVSVRLRQLFDLFVHSFYHQVDIVGLFLQVLHVLVVFRLQLLRNISTVFYFANQFYVQIEAVYDTCIQNNMTCKAKNLLFTV